MSTIEPSPKQLADMHERANREKISFSELVQQFYADQIVADVFDEDQAALTKQRAAIASAQTKLDHAEAAARDKATGYCRAVERRDLLSAKLKRASEQLAEIHWAIPDQDRLICDSIGCVEKFAPVDVGTVYMLTERIAFREKLEKAILVVEDGIVRLKEEFAVAEAAVSQFEKAK